MILGRVVGEVWATRKHPALDGRKLLIIRPHLWYAPAHEVANLVAVDPVGAGVGEDVVVCMGDPARRQLGAIDNRQAARHGLAAAPRLAPLGSLSIPVEAAVCAIVDRVEIDEKAHPRPLKFVGPRPRMT